MNNIKFNMKYNERLLFRCNDLLGAQRLMLKVIDKDCEEPKITYKRLMHRINGLLAINRSVSDNLISIGDSKAQSSAEDDASVVPLNKQTAHQLSKFLK